MSNPREAQFRKLVQDYPESPMGHFSLGKLLLDEKRFAEATVSLEQAVRLNPTYAAALVSLADAYLGAGDNGKAREVLVTAKQTALAQSHPSLAEEIEERLQSLE